MILNNEYNRQDVIASHIWKFSKRFYGLERLGLTIKDINSPRNGLLLVKAIEEKFDIKDVCFLYDPLKQMIFLKILNPGIFDIVVLPSPKTFREIDGSPLKFPKDRPPFRRILNLHALLSFRHAKAMGWSTVGPDEVVNNYFDLSDTASMPELLFNDEKNYR